jgi:alkanesulfonate monooxygenase SsuD/methylene tetrahydromethanopterin reductase-like flavin-dependent oxidoreductase (luciferase family)
MEDHGTDPSTRGRLVDERLRAIRELWTKEKAEFHGDFVDFEPIYSWPKPVQRPHPPIYVGGGEGAFRRVAELGDAWLANSVPPERLSAQIDHLRAIAGRDVPVTVYGVPGEPDVIEGYSRLAVERVLLYLPTMPEKETLEYLDRLARAAARFR